MSSTNPLNQDLPLPAALFTTLLCILFGANAVAIKVSLAELGPFTTAGIRFGAAAMAISCWAAATGRSFHIQKRQIPQLLLISGFFTLQLSLLYMGFARTLASRGTLLINVQPFFILFLAHFFIPGDRITPRKFIGLLLGFAGLVLVVLPDGVLRQKIRPGDLLILATAFVWACNMVYTKRIIRDYDPFIVVLYPMAAATPVFLLIAAVFEGDITLDMSSRAVGALVYQSLVTASFGFVAWNALLRRFGAVSLHSFIFLMPVAGVFLSRFVLSEPLDWNILAALTLIAAGIIVINLSPKRYGAVFPSRGL